MSVFAMLVLAALWATAPAWAIGGTAVNPPLSCEVDPCGVVLPGAARFERIAGKPYVAGFDDAGALVGWVARSTDIVDIKGYSGQPLSTVVGLGTDGSITGGRVVNHSEPILLIGIPEEKLHRFVDGYQGFQADQKVVVGGKATDPDTVSFDIISGATVTVLAENQTILETVRSVGTDVGVVQAAARVPGHFVSEEPWSWERLVDEGALGHLVVRGEEMGETDPEGLFLDMWFGIADAPQVGIPLMGEGRYRHLSASLEPGEHLLVVFNGGTSSYKGSGFVRGGIFDRFHLTQGLRDVVFTDLDYTKLDSPPAEGAPELWEGGVFITRDHRLDPGARYQMVFLGSAYALERGAFERDFRTFEVEHRVPSSVYTLDGPDPETLIWRQAWQNGWPKALITGLYFLAVGLLFAGRRWMAGDMKRLQRLHTGVMTASFVGLGLWLHVQPSVTQVMTLLDGAASGHIDFNLFLSDPVLFVSWIGVVLIGIPWGRGTFCGWICPYGAMSELVFKLARKLRIPELELPDAVHFKLRYLRYGVFGLLAVVFLVDPLLGERMAEVEPFKSTFFVPIWTRHPALVLWWASLLVWSITTYRPFCRYLCPLGAALAVPSSFRISGPYRREFCSKCKICTRGCEPRAIRPDGTIDPRECLNCWECEANYNDETVCPPLVKKRRDRERAAAPRPARRPSP